MNTKEILKPKTEKELRIGIEKFLQNQKLSKCASLGLLDGVSEALNAGADINYRYIEGDESPLEWAVYCHFYNIIDLLVEKGAPVDHCEIFRRILDEYPLDIRYHYFEMLYNGELCGLDLDFIFSYIDEEHRKELTLYLPKLNLVKRTSNEFINN